MLSVAVAGGCFGVMVDGLEANLVGGVGVSFCGGGRVVRLASVVWPRASNSMCAGIGPGVGKLKCFFNDGAGWYGLSSYIFHSICHCVCRKSKLVLFGNAGMFG